MRGFVPFWRLSMPCSSPNSKASKRLAGPEPTRGKWQNFKHLGKLCLKECPQLFKHIPGYLTSKLGLDPVCFRTTVAVLGAFRLDPANLTFLSDRQSAFRLFSQVLSKSASDWGEARGLMPGGRGPQTPRHPSVIRLFSSAQPGTALIPGTVLNPGLS